MAAEEGVTTPKKSKIRDHRWASIFCRKRFGAGIALFCFVVIVICVIVYEQTKDQRRRVAPGPRSLDSDFTILYYNDLYGHMSPHHEAMLLLEKEQPHANATNDCMTLSEELFTPQTAYNYSINMDYLAFLNPSWSTKRFWISGGTNETCSTLTATGEIGTANCNNTLPALCSQRAPLTAQGSYDTSSKWRVAVTTDTANYTGFRDRRSFRFQGIRYAEQPTRFTHTTAYSESNAVDAIKYGSECMQSGNIGDEDCFFLNIFSPHLPTNAITSDRKKPVMVWIHGGAFLNGAGSSEALDGGNLASRGDVVVVTINYRLGSLGFLAMDGTSATGNWGLGDQITALEWVRRNIVYFGGDPDNITLFGQSAGAASIRALLGSPLTEGRFAAAIAQSNPGGISWLGPFSEYTNVSTATRTYTQPVLDALGCSSSADNLKCLRSKKASDIADLGPQANVLVNDGVILKFDELAFNRSSTMNKVPVIFGTMRDDAVWFTPDKGNPNILTYLDDAGLDATLVANTSAYPSISSNFSIPANYTSGMTLPQNVTNFLDGISSINVTSPITLEEAVYDLSQQILTNAMFRCIDQATVVASRVYNVFPKFWYYEFDRSYGYYPNKPQCNAPNPSKQYPWGNPNEPYFRCHSGDLLYTFGNLVFTNSFLRDDNDILFSQYIVDSWTQFAWNHDPNPNPAYLQARNYTTTLNLVKQQGIWPAISGNSTADTGLVKRLLSANSTDIGFTQRDQCNAIGYPFEYYI